jgi:hypothetical protein
MIGVHEILRLGNRWLVIEGLRCKPLFSELQWKAFAWSSKLLEPFAR